ncbi:hypothetical protein C8R44DRAFT_726230 [Mycena epipterygia]|nr:hypothetical protein C8R44DRAFT_726230 [Mycena epipterygia]
MSDELKTISNWPVIGASGEGCGCSAGQQIQEELTTQGGYRSRPETTVMQDVESQRYIEGYVTIQKQGQNNEDGVYISEIRGHKSEQSNGGMANKDRDRDETQFWREHRSTSGESSEAEHSRHRKQGVIWINNGTEGVLTGAKKNQ